MGRSEHCRSWSLLARACELRSEPRLHAPRPCQAGRAGRAGCHRLPTKVVARSSLPSQYKFRA